MKKYLKKTARFTAYALGSLTGLILLYIGAAWLLSRVPVNRHAAPAGDTAVSIYIRTNGVHTDIVTPVRNAVKDWRPDIPFTDTGSGDTAMAYIAFGWGDKGFYLQTPEWSDLKFSVAFKAMFHLGSTAMHTTFYKTMPTGASCKEIRISATQYRKLVAYLEGSFRKDDRGRFIAIATANDGYGDDDAFYEANGVYDLFHTCNTWANNALKACDQRACLWTPIDKGIFYQYRER